MAKLQETFKLRVKFGDHEFEAEGPQEAVIQRFEEFRELIRSAPSPTVSPHAKPAPAPSEEEPSWVGTLIRHDPRSRVISLRVLPEGEEREADAALLLLLAYKQARAEDEVSVTVLKEALSQSGCPVPRLDRALALQVKEHLVLKTGRGKGGKYRLTNKGLARAEALARELSGHGT